MSMYNAQYTLTAIIIIDDVLYFKCALGNEKFFDNDFIETMMIRTRCSSFRVLLLLLLQASENS